MDEREGRRSSRIAGRFWVAIEGVDAEWIARRGDISATGLFFEVENDIGDVGTVQWLHIRSEDKKRTVDVMANVVRVASLTDVVREVKGVALEFMPESDQAAANLCDFVRYVLESPAEKGNAPHIAPRVEARASSIGHLPTPANVSQLSVRTLLLETDWSVAVGEPVRVEIIARGVKRPVRVEGHTVSVLPLAGSGGDDKRYRIAVQVKEEIAGPLRTFSSGALAAVGSDAIANLQTTPQTNDQESGAPGETPLARLFSALIEPPKEPSVRSHLAGLLARIPFPSLCSLLELERLTGELRIRRGEEELTLYVRDGRFVDVVSNSGRTARADVSTLLECRDGAFELFVVPVDRPDRLDLSMTQLLLDVAREVDESAETETPTGDFL